MSNLTGESLTVTPAEGLLGLQRREMGEVSVAVIKVAGEVAIEPVASQELDDFPAGPAYHYLDN